MTFTRQGPWTLRKPNDPHGDLLTFTHWGAYRAACIKLYDWDPADNAEAFNYRDATLTNPVFEQASDAEILDEFEDLTFGQTSVFEDAEDVNKDTRGMAKDDLDNIYETLGYEKGYDY